MQDKWYGDNRDLIKWTTIFHVAQDNGLSDILHVVYYRKHEYPKVMIGDDNVVLPREIYDHFRDVRTIAEIRQFNNKSINIELIMEEFDNRVEYLQNIKSHISRYKKPFLLFLDPDTGLEPKNNPNHNHVYNEELKALWGSMSKQSVLVFYQHQTNKTGKPWIEPKRKQLASCINRQSKSITVAKSAIAHDVVLFVIQK